MDLNYVENRYANKMPDFSFGAYLDNSFQSGMESALVDQIYGGQHLNKWYNEATSSRILKIAERGAENHPDFFYSYRDVYLHDDRILWQPFDRDEFQTSFDETVEALNRSIDENPTLPYYFYFVESDAVYDFNNIITGPISLEAKYTKDTYQISFTFFIYIIFNLMMLML